MLTVTSAALDCLSRKLAEKRPTGELALRLRHVRSAWKLRLDRVRPEDTTFDHEGRKVLLLDEATARTTADLTLDVRTKSADPQLKLRRTAEREA